MTRRIGWMSTAICLAAIGVTAVAVTAAWRAEAEKRAALAELAAAREMAAINAPLPQSEVDRIAREARKISEDFERRAAERDADELRRITPLVFASGAERHGNGIRILDHVRLAGGKDWAFLVQIVPFERDVGGQTQTVGGGNETIVVRGGVVAPDAADEGYFWWCKYTPDEVARRYVAANLDGPSDVSDVAVEKPGTMTAIATGRETGRRWRLVVENYATSNVYPAD